MLCSCGFFSLPVHSSLDTEVNHKKLTIESDIKKLSDDKKLPIELRLFADRQYDLNEKIFVAEGNVKAKISGGILKADRIEYNRNKQLLLAQGNVVFIRGGQYFQSSSLSYDFSKEIGQINNAYGVIKIDSLSKDLAIIATEKDIANSNIKMSKNQIKNIKLRDGYIIKAGNIGKEDENIFESELEMGLINNWRFQSDKLILKSNGWSSEKINFTNDPLNPTQTRIEAEGVIAKQGENEQTVILFRKSRLILEDHFSIPLLKNKQFGQSQEFRWSLGIDFTDRDGFFLGRKFDDINLAKDFSLSLQPQFYIQRSINGETNSYISPGSSVLSNKVNATTNIYDLFGLKADINGRKNNIELDFNTIITTFDGSRFSNGYRYKGSLSKEIDIPKLDKIKASLFTSYRYPTWNGSLGESDIYYASGMIFEKKIKSQSSKSKNEYIARIGSGHYESEEYNKKSLIKLWKTNIYTLMKSKRQIYKSRNTISNQNLLYRYTPEPVEPGLNFNTEISASYSFYGNDRNQGLIKFAAGPELTIGYFSEKFFDYTRLSIMPAITVKDGASPFKFDNEVDLRTIELELDQQIIGPLLLSTEIELNIDNNSTNYGKFLSSKTALILKRRSYEFGLFYQPSEKSGGIQFRLNGFSFNQSGRPFVDFINNI